MTTLLHINSSLWGQDSRSGQLAKTLIEQLQQDSTMIARDLAAEPLPHLSAAAYEAFALAADQRSSEQQQALALSDTLSEELISADQIVLSAPMYNYGLPSTLKAWLDHVVRVGVTFQYGANGIEGLLEGKILYVVSTRGGKHAGTERDLLSQHIQLAFGMMGISDIRFIYAEGLAFGEEAATAELARAKQTITELAA